MGKVYCQSWRPEEFHLGTDSVGETAWKRSRKISGKENDLAFVKGISVPREQDK